MNRLIAIVTVGALLVTVAAWLAWEWQPERQARRATFRLLAAVEDRDWKGVRDLLAPGYRDAWGYDRAGAIQDASEAFRQFFVIDFEPGDFAVTPGVGAALRVSGRVKLEGNGTALAQLMMSRVNELKAPFEFEWRKESWKPWDWYLYSLDQSELSLSSGSNHP